MFRDFGPASVETYTRHSYGHSLIENMHWDVGLNGLADKLLVVQLQL